MANWSLNLISIALVGQTCRWLIIAPLDSQRLEEAFNAISSTKNITDHEMPCGRFICTPSWLSQYHIKFVEVNQQAGDILVIPANCYYQKIMLGWSIQRETVFAPARWHVNLQATRSHDCEAGVQAFCLSQAMISTVVQNEGLQIVKPVSASRHTTELSCPSCLHKSTRLADWNRHQKTHSAHTDQQCNDCGLTLLTRRYESHRKAHRNELQVCDICGKHVADVNDHKYATHNRQQRRHQCELCKKKFVSPKHLSRHEKVCAHRQWIVWYKYITWRPCTMT